MWTPTLKPSQPPSRENVQPSSTRITPTMRADSGAAYNGTSCGVKRSHAPLPNTSGNASRPTTCGRGCAKTDAGKTERKATAHRYFILQELSAEGVTHQTHRRSRPSGIHPSPLVNAVTLVNAITQPSHFLLFSKKNQR